VRVTPEDVHAAIEHGAQYLRRNLLSNEYQPLTVLALLNAGVPLDDPALRRTISGIMRSHPQLMQEQYHGSYQGGVLLMILALLKDDQYRQAAAEIARKLQRFQEFGGGWGDNSRTQFALLGLKAAEDLGIEVPDTVFKSAYKYVANGQNADGGWGYTPNDRRSYGSMTAAGITSLYICGARAYKGTKVCGEAGADRRLAAGMEWLARNFGVRHNPGVGGGHHFYYLYGLERIGVILATRTIGGHDWYREGAEFLVRSQAADGSWNRDVAGTQFALLFLSKGSRPVAVQKLQYGEGWNSDPYDLKELTERASKDLKTPMTFQVVDTRASAGELAGAPILYLQGHNSFEFDAKFREALRLFVEQGGFIFASACCGSRDFDRAFRAEMKRVFPDGEFEPLPPEHPVYRAPHRIGKQEAFMLEVLNTGCRSSVFYAPHDLCCALGGCEGCRDTAPVPAEPARQLGVNLIAYALGFQRLHDKLEDPPMPAPGAKAERAGVAIGQLYHTGDWLPDPAAIPNLGRTLRKDTGMKGDIVRRRVTLGADDPGDYPVLYLAGHRDFSFSNADIRILREYLDRGGFLFADCCCGKAEFDQAFRRLCEQLYPDKPLERLPLDHAIFQAPFSIQEVQYRPAVAARYPEIGRQPRLEGIVSKDRLTVVYSRFNLGCALQGHPCPGCLGVQEQDAYHLAVNVIVYALSH
jgi:hypothetical protein